MDYETVVSAIGSLLKGRISKSDRAKIRTNLQSMKAENTNLVAYSANPANPQR
jgi:hypothetical protein